MLHAVGEDGVIRVSTTADRAKYHNLRREPWAALKVDGESFWSYAVIEARGVVLRGGGRPAATRRSRSWSSCSASISGEHSDWDDYRRAMVAEQRVVVRLTPDPGVRRPALRPRAESACDDSA